MLFGARYAKNFDLSGVVFDNPVHNTIADFIKEKQKKGETVRASALFDIFDENTPELSEILDLSLGETLEGVGAAKYFDDCVRTLERIRTQKELARLSALCDAETDLQKKKEITRQVLALAVKLKNF